MPSPEREEEGPLLTNAKKEAMLEFLKQREDKYAKKMGEGKIIVWVVNGVVQEMETATGGGKLLGSERGAWEKLSPLVSKLVAGSENALSDEALAEDVLKNYLKKNSPSRFMAKETPSTEAGAGFKDEGPFTSVADLLEKYEQVLETVQGEDKSNVMAEWVKLQTLELSEDDQAELNNEVGKRAIKHNPLSESQILSLYLINQIINRKKQARPPTKMERISRPAFTPEHLEVKKRYREYVSGLEASAREFLGLNPNIKYEEAMEKWRRTQDFESVDAGVASEFSHSTGETLGEKIYFRVYTGLAKEFLKRDGEAAKKPEGLWGKFKGLFGG